jgi:hypothetical protein
MLINEHSIFRIECRQGFRQSSSRPHDVLIYSNRAQGVYFRIGMSLAEQAPMFGFSVAQCGKFRECTHPRDKPFFLRNGRSFRNGLA